MYYSSQIIITLFLFQPALQPWWENSAIIGPLIGLTGGLLMFYLNRWWERRTKLTEKAEKDEERDEEQHISLISKFADVGKIERDKLHQDLLELHHREIIFYQEQLKIKDIAIHSIKKSEYAARIRAARLSAELNEAKNTVIIFREIAKKFKIDLPEFLSNESTHHLIEQKTKEALLLNEASNILDTDLNDMPDIEFNSEG